MGNRNGDSLQRLIGPSHPDSAETPPNSPPITTNSSTVTKDTIPIVLNGTSLAAASCPNGDRWVFLQDVQGNVRGCQYSVSSSNWSVLPNTTIPATAKLGSPLGASCEDIEAGLSSPNLNSGRYVSFCARLLAVWDLLTDKSPLHQDIRHLHEYFKEYY